MKLQGQFFFFLVLLVLTQSCPGLSQDISFNEVTLPDETINEVITGITQDLQGNMWFSSNGLHQFDGIHLKSYIHDPLNAASLADNKIECVYADKNGNIWAGTYGAGLEKFDPETGVFTHYKHNEHDPSSISGDSVTCILQDHEGVLWVGTYYEGLNRMDPKTGKFIHYRYKESDPNSLSFDQVRVIYEDKQGVLWVGTGAPFYNGENDEKKGGLNRLNRNSATFTRYMHNENDPHSLIDNRVRAIFEDSYGNFWVGTAGDGLHTMDRAKGEFERHTYDPAQPEKLSRPPLKNDYPFADDHITFITEDLKRTIWIGTFENGIVRYDPASKKVKHYRGQKDSSGNFSESTTWWECTSREGVMWVSLWGGGLYRFDPSHQNIEHTHLKGQFLSLAEEPGDIRWMGTDSGLLRINTKNNSTQLFAHDEGKPGSISNNVVLVLYKDKQNRLWAGTNDGLNLFNPDRQNFTVYKNDPKITTSLINNVIFCLHEDEQSNLWVGTFNGLDKMNVEKGQFTHYSPFPNDTVPGRKNFVTCMLEDSKRNFWIGTPNTGGVHLLNPETGKFKHYLPEHSVVSIREDGYGKIWVGSEEGIFSYDSTNDSFALFTDPSTGYSIGTRAMVQDDNKNLWIASPTGIYRLNTKQGEVSRFSKDFGIDGITLQYISAYKANDGQLFFGNTDGYYSFYPDKINSNTKPPEIILSDFRIGDHEVKPGKDSVLKEDILFTKEITLSHNQNSFSFLFNVIHYSNPDANRAMYMLENYDKAWRPAGSEHTAYYYNIPPGHYTFRIRAASSYGVWAEKDISIVVKAPWWSTWWAYCMYGLLLVAVAFGIHRFQKARIIRAERERSHAKEIAQAKEIEKAYHELKTTQTQLIQQEKMASLGELTAGIAHEIQNPLNFVNNFSEVNSELIFEMKDEISKGNMDEAKAIADDIEENEKKIIHHGKRADAIVKSMLQHSRTSSGQKEPTDINALADEYLRLSYHGLRAKEKSLSAGQAGFNATMKTDYDPGIGKINIISQDIGRVLLNLFNNAFYAVTEKKNQSNGMYEPTVWVTTKRVNSPSGNGSIEIRVKDNGNGVPQKVLDKIFHPFFTTKPVGQGTGLGLSLSYDIIKAHGGEIKVVTKEGEGSEFVIVLVVQ